MSPKLIQILLAIIAAAMDALKTNREDAKQVSNLRNASIRVDELIHEANLQPLEERQVRNAVNNLVLHAAAARPPTDEHIKTTRLEIDKRYREGTAGRDDLRDQPLTQVEKHNEQAAKQDPRFPVDPYAGQKPSLESPIGGLMQPPAQPPGNEQK